MANEEHVKRLKQGVAEWNAWREKSESLSADLSHTNLGNADLRKANLSNANLSHAYLVHADMRGANLPNADLTLANMTGSQTTGAILTNATLVSASLDEANLIRTNLRGADLQFAQLRFTNLTNSYLRGANLTAATLSYTVFSDTDLSDIIGLEECLHQGPSVIDHQTLRRSRSVPLRFLRGVGLPDSLIEYLPSLLNQAIQYYSCFISYSSRDQDFADRIHADLQNQGVRCWFAPHDMPIGGKILDEIDAAIRLRDKVLLILSENSIRSDWVEDEVSKAFAEERKRGETVLFPVRLDDAVMDTSEAWAVKLRDQRNIGHFRRWKDHDGYKTSFERVLRDLKRAASKDE